MYNINTKSGDFTERTKTVFDVLANLESSHKSKELEYIENSEQEVKNFELKQNEINPVGVSGGVQTSECLFKVPAVPKRTIESNEIKSSKRHRGEFSRDPHKWKKYSLEDVEEAEMSNGANYAAAMDFLNELNKSKNDEKIDDQGESVQIVFNRPIGKKKQLDLSEESIEKDEENLVETNLVEKKKFTKRNVRSFRRVEREDEKGLEENESKIVMKKVTIKNKFYKRQEEGETTGKVSDEEMENSDIEKEEIKDESQDEGEEGVDTQDLFH